MRGPRSAEARRGKGQHDKRTGGPSAEDPRARDLRTLRSRLAERRSDGLVTCMYGSHADVSFDDGSRGFCLITPKLHKLQGLCVGDRVHSERGAHDAERVLIGRDERSTELRRLRGDDDREGHVIAANADCMAIVAALTEPPLRPGALDRYLVLASVLGLSPLLVLTKAEDDPDGRDHEAAIAAYRGLCPVVFTSARTGLGIPVLADHLRGHLSVFSGHSGVGKSSLCQALGLANAPAAGALTERGRGRHTTSVAQLLSLPGGGWVIDTPGVRAIGFVDLDRRVARAHFPDFAELARACAFPSCLHEDEEDCAVIDAVERGDLARVRYDGYRRLLASL